MMTCTLKITVPGENGKVVAPGRHIAVRGTIDCKTPLPDDAVLTATLTDASGKLLRRTVQKKKNNPSLVLYREDLTGYPEEIDPGREGMRKYGFPEAAVRDPADPEASFRDATIKSFYSDVDFKTFFVGGTDRAHGAILDDGIGFTDESGAPYTAPPEGKYLITVTLCDRNGTLLGKDETRFEIASPKDALIGRFHPEEHRARITAWAEENGFAVYKDTMPGYLDAYAGVWLYHMGLLPMYRAGDVSLYVRSKAHMFVYLIDRTSTSFATEFGFLLSSGAVGDPNRFAAYRYDVGEAVVGDGTPFRREGKIVPFADGENLVVCRVDTVNESAQENEFDLDAHSVSAFGTGNEISVPAGSRIAVMGAFRPLGISPENVRLRPDNRYDLTGYPNRISYTLTSDSGEQLHAEKPTGMLRLRGGVPLGDSVFEFYHLFQIPSRLRNHHVRLHASLRLPDGSPCRSHNNSISPSGDPVVTELYLNIN